MSPLNTSYNIITINDVKLAARKNTKVKWQKRWDLGTSGRHLYNITPNIRTTGCMDIPSKEIGTIITGLRTGYSLLNKY